MIPTRDELMRELLKILESDNPCSRCPGFYFDIERDDRRPTEEEIECCSRCRELANLSPVEASAWEEIDRICPCHILGEEALKRAWINLDEWLQLPENKWRIE